MVENCTYIPARGDIVWLSFNPKRGHEQSGHRPAVTLSPKKYNEKVGMAIFCPVTTSVKNYPFEVAIPKSCPLEGVVLSDQIRNLDYKARNVKFICHLPKETIKDVQDRIIVLLK